MPVKPSHIFGKRKLLRLMSAAVVLLALAGLVLRPSEAVTAAKDGLLMCFNVIMPSLFPFFVLSSMVVELGLVRYIGFALERVMRPLFRVSGACAAAVALGFIGGYPTGARTAISIYEKKLCSKTEVERLLAFCNNSGPAFILGVVGAGVFSSSLAGILLYLCHIFASFAVGIVMRFYKRNEPASGGGRYAFSTAGLGDAFVLSVKSALSSTLGICAFVVFFTVAIGMLMQFGIIPFFAGIFGGILAPFGLDASTIEQLITGLIEVSSGVWTLQDAAGGIRTQLALAAFMLGWAGLSVHCQVLSFIGKSGLSAKTYVAGKFLHGIISAALVWAVSGLFNFSAPVSAYLVEQLDGLNSLNFTAALTLSLGASALLILLFSVPLFIDFCKNRWKSRGM